ncbi:hypothetical protein JHK87_031830 [Glycine soja]|nr:hypothetical protein JHK87_031830 [Glycine soja]
MSIWIPYILIGILYTVEATKNVELGNIELSRAIQRNSSRTFLLLFLSKSNLGIALVGVGCEQNKVDVRVDNKLRKTSEIVLGLSGAYID